MAMNYGVGRRRYTRHHPSMYILHPDPAREQAEEPVTRVQFAGELVGTQAADNLEVLHVRIDDRSHLAQQHDITKLISKRVVVTVELSPMEEQEGGDVV